MSVNWDKFTIPSWARWIAQDGSGAWWAYEHEPNQFHKGWYENEVGRSVCIVSDEPNTDWVTTLKKL